MFAAIAIVALADWTRAPAQQWSPRAYQFVVIDGYRAFVRPMTSRLTYCPFSPTCSHYSEEAMRKYGFVKGLGLTMWRLLRCGPWTKTGTRDPVP